MTHRERVLAALSHQVTDRVPMDFWAVPEVWEKLYKHFGTTKEEEVLEQLGVDIHMVWPEYIGPEMPTFEDGSFMEPMGTHRRNVKNEFSTYQEYASAPMGKLETPQEVEDFPFAQVSWWNMEGLSEQIGNRHETHYIKIQTGGLFELAWALRGYEQFFMDLADEPEIVHALMNKICTFYCEFVEKALTCAGDKIDMVYTYDDIAAQNALLMSPGMMEEFIFPYHRRLNKVIKSFGKKVMYHSCGAVFPVIDKLIDLPIDVLNPLQPLAKDMDFKVIKEKFGQRVCFHGGICIQQTLPSGTPEEVRQAVFNAVDILAKDGGYILTSAHYIQADTPLENILALFEAGKQAVPQQS